MKALTDLGVIVRDIPKQALAARRGALGTCSFALIGLMDLGAALYCVEARAAEVPEDIEWLTH